MAQKVLLFLTTGFGERLCGQVFRLGVRRLEFGSFKKKKQTILFLIAVQGTQQKVLYWSHMFEGHRVVMLSTFALW